METRTGVDPSTVVAEARKLVGTPFHHQGRRPGVGIDCLGVLVLTARGAGRDDIEDVTSYERRPQGLLAGLEAHFERVARIEPGRVLAFTIRSRDVEPSHVAIATGTGRMIHVVSGGRVVETSISTSWLRRLHSVWRI